MNELLKQTYQSLANRAASAVDGAVAYAVTRSAIASPRADSDERLRLIFSLYGSWPEVQEHFAFQQSRPIVPILTPPGPEGVEDLTWLSGYEPFFPQHRDTFASAANARASARVFWAGAASPVLIVVHGYRAGQYALEQRVWPLSRFRAMGFTVALFTLPFHGVRLGPGEGRAFPDRDPRANLEGLRQAIFDLGNLIDWFRERGHARVGITGMSLGGYVASLLCTAREDLSFLLPWIPLSSFADFALEQGHLGGELEKRARAHRALEEIYGVASPLRRTPRILPERTLVIGARADAITPITHAQRLAFAAMEAFLSRQH
jgi:hypothetical protein